MLSSQDKEDPIAKERHMAWCVGVGGRARFCLVVASETRYGFGQEIVRELRGTVGIAARTALLGSIALRAEGLPDAIVLVLDATAIAGGAELIQRALREMPACLVLVVGNRLRKTDVSTRRASGSFDYVSDAWSPTETGARVRRALDASSDTRCADVRELLKPRVRGLIGNSPTFLKQVSKLPTIAGC